MHERTDTSTSPPGGGNEAGKGKEAPAFLAGSLVWLPDDAEVCACARVYVCMHEYLHAYMCACMNRCMGAHVHVCIVTCVQMCMHASVCTCV